MSATHQEQAPASRGTAPASFDWVENCRSDRYQYCAPTVRIPADLPDSCAASLRTPHRVSRETVSLIGFRTVPLAPKPRLGSTVLTPRPEYHHKGAGGPLPPMGTSRAVLSGTTPALHRAEDPNAPWRGAGRDLKGVY